MESYLTLILLILYGLGSVNVSDCAMTMSIEEIFYQYEDEKNSVIAVPPNRDKEETYEDFYDEFDSWMSVTDSMNIIFFGPSTSFVRMDSETILHIFMHTKKHLIPISKVLLAWDLITDGKTAAYLQGRELLAFGPLLNVVPEEDLYYVNFGTPSVLKYFANNKIHMSPRKAGVLVASYKRYFGNEWYANATSINDLGYLLCGFPTSDYEHFRPEVVRRITVSTLNKVRTCSLKQATLMYQKVTEKAAYNLPYKWTWQDVAQLGLMITLIPKDEIPSLSLEAITAITPEVMKAMCQDKLDYFTKDQIISMTRDTRRIYALRMQLKDSLTVTELSKKHKPPG